MDSSPEGAASDSLERRKMSLDKKRQRTKGRGTTIRCKNWACQAILNGKDTFCKRCSCFICHKYTDIRDPSLWLTCDGESCGCFFHLNCAFKSDKSGLKEDKPSNGHDGCFFCIMCGKKNSILECWKEQLQIAKETENMCELSQRLLLAQKLLRGTEKYKDVSKFVEKAAESLVNGLEKSKSPKLCSPQSILLSSKCRGSIKRLGLKATEVKDHCSSALKSLQEELISADVLLSILPNDIDLSLEAKSNTLSEEKQEATPEDLPIAPLRLDQISDHQDRPKNATSIEKSENCCFWLEDCVKITRKLESSGHIRREFREKFLSWYGLRATSYEMRVVKAFVNGFKDDPEALADQLMDTFSECIWRNGSANDGGGGGGSSRGGVLCKKPRH